MARAINSRRKLLIPALILFLAVAASSFKIFNNEEGRPLSPTDFVIDADNNQLIVVQKTGKRIDFADLLSGEITTSIPTELPPNGICFGDSGSVYVTCSYSTGYVLKLDRATRKIVGKFMAGHGANSPVYSQNRELLYVANQFNDDVSVINPKDGQEISRIKVRRQPMAMDITPDNDWLYVANLLPASRADIDTVAAEVSIIDLGKNKAIKHLKLSNGSNALRGIKIAPNGKHAFISHNLGRFQVPTSQLEQGWMNTSALSIIDIDRQQVIGTILLDEPERGAAGSWGVDVNEHVIVVNHSGTHDYSVIDYHQMLEKLEKVEDREVLSYDLRFLTDIRQRYPVSGDGPRAIKIYGNNIYNALYFADAIQIDDLNTRKNISVIALNPGLQIDSVRLGEMVFNDARHCFQQWQSCNGCHPNEARTDGLNWDLLNDGIGNPKNCKSMLLAHKTPPSMISGIRPTAEIAVRAGFRHIQFAQIDEGMARAVDQYLMSLQPIPSPYLADGKLSEKAEKGKKIFEKIKCNDCHSGPYFTDQKKHKIGDPESLDRNDSWDTPTLIEVWRTGPYLYDGRSVTIEDLLVNEKHGIFQELKKDDLDALIEYVLSL